MFTVSVETHFWASHRLALPDGLKESAHRHNWQITVDVSSKELNSMGLVIDFGRLKGMVEEVVAEFDNVPLDNIEYFRQNNSSAEMVAKYIYDKLRSKLSEGVRLEAVRVVEEPGCSARFAAEQVNG